MTRHSVETEPKPAWAIELERIDGDGQTEFYSVHALQCGPERLQFITAGGTQVSLDSKDLRKVLLMRVKDDNLDP